MYHIPIKKKQKMVETYQVVMVIIKLPNLWRDFSTSLKYHREEKSMDNHISSLDVEKKAQSKDNTSEPSITIEFQSKHNLVKINHYIGVQETNQIVNPNQTNYFG